MALLFDSAGDLRDIRHSSFNISSLATPSDDLIVAVTKSIVRLNSQTCEIMQNINVSPQMTDIVAAISLPEQATLVALADSSILYVPKNTMTTSDLAPLPWPIQPLSLQSLSSSSILVTCKNNTLCELQLSELTSVPKLPTQSKAKTKNASFEALATCIVGRSSQTFMTVGMNPIGSSSSNSLDLSIWKRGVVSSTQSTTSDHRWYLPETSTSVKIKTIDESSQRFLTMCTDGICKFTCIVLTEHEGANNDIVRKTSARGRRPKESTTDADLSASTDKKNGFNQWMKVSDTGVVIFSRHLSNKPLQANASGNLLFLLSSNSVDLWDISYGVQNFTMEVSYSIPQNMTVSQTSITNFTPQTMVVVPTSRDGSSFNLFFGLTSSTASTTTSILCADVQNTKYKNTGTLLQAFGGLSQCSDILGSSSSSSVSTKDSDDFSRENSYTEGDKYKILGGLSSREKREISKAQKKLDDTKHYIIDDSDEKDGGKKKKSNHRRRLVLSDVPPECCSNFMLRLDAALRMRQEATAKDQHTLESRSKSKSLSSSNVSVQILPSDWDALRTILHTSAVAISKYPFLIPTAADLGRADILQTISCYCPDLSEIDAIRLLNYVTLLPNDTLDALRIDERSGLIVWGKDKKATSDIEGGKNSKKRKAIATERLSLSSSSTANCSHLSILLGIMMSILKRTDGYSPILLSEAIRKGMDTFSASILLRILAFMLKDVFAISDSITHVSGSLEESQITQAITWAESIIDAHFSSLAIALTASLDTYGCAKSATTSNSRDRDLSNGKSIEKGARQSSSRISIVKTINAVANIDQECDEIENLMGTWEQVLAMHQSAHRTDKRGRIVNSAPVGIYCQETLVL